MTTAREVIYRALRQLGVSDPDETPTGRQASDALVALNAMVHGWKANGVDVGHADWTLDDEVDLEIDPEFVRGLSAMLAIDLAPEYPGAQINVAVGKMSDDGWKALIARYHDTSTDSDLTCDAGLQSIGIQRWP